MSSKELIGRFMGLNWNVFEQLKYNYESNWSDLMPVLEKIQSIEIVPPPRYQGYRIEIVLQGYVRISGFPMPLIIKNVSIEGSLIRAVYSAVVEFIKWYNENGKEKT